MTTNVKPSLINRLLYLIIFSSLLLFLSFPLSLGFTDSNSVDNLKYSEYNLEENISLGNNHSGMIDANNNLFLWGSNINGQIGNGGYSSSADFTNVSLLNRNMGFVKDFELGWNFSGAIDKDDDLWMWGENEFGQVGNNSSENNVLSPTNISLISNIGKVKKIILGNSHSAAIDMDNDLWMWGGNGSGQVGNGEFGKNILVPTNISDLNNGIGTVKDVSLGNSHTLAIDNNDNVWVWGSNSYGQLGLGNAILNSSIPINLSVESQNLNEVLEVSVGSSHSAVIDTNGELWTWGRNNQGQIGNGSIGVDDSEKIWVPVNISEINTNLPDISGISFGNSFSSLIDVDGDLWMWGDNGFEQLGINDGSIDNIPIPTNISDLNSEMGNISSISMGGTHSSAFDSDGGLWMWGNNSNDQIDLELDDYILKPMKISLPVTAYIDEILVTEISKTTAIVEIDFVQVENSNKLGKIGLKVTGSDDVKGDEDISNPISGNMTWNLTNLIPDTTYTFTILFNDIKTSYTSSFVTSKNKNINAIIGGTIGGLAGVTLIVGGIYFLIKRKKFE